MTDDRCVVLVAMTPPTLEDSTVAFLRSVGVDDVVTRFDEEGDVFGGRHDAVITNLPPGQDTRGPVTIHVPDDWEHGGTVVVWEGSTTHVLETFEASDLLALLDRFCPVTQLRAGRVLRR